jgi:phenylpropionate dioxygenase-like ring-hydroxylating dioxygenase large terminal subunit
VENFLDVAHLPFVHDGILGTSEQPKIPDFSVDTHENGIEARDVEVWQPDPDGSGEGKYVAYDYVTHGALTAQFYKRQGDNVFSNFVTVTPVDESTSLMWVYEALNFNHDIPEENLRERQGEITYQDIPIVESQRPELLPLDLQAELHRPSDRCSVAYRKWLQKKGMSFGTA